MKILALLLFIHVNCQIEKEEFYSTVTFHKINSEKVLYGLFVGSDIQEDYLKKNYFLINNKIYYALLPLIEFEKIYFEELY